MRTLSCVVLAKWSGVSGVDPAESPYEKWIGLSEGWDLVASAGFNLAYPYSAEVVACAVQIVLCRRDLSELPPMTEL
jgi:hypothetical protein